MKIEYKGVNDILKEKGIKYSNLNVFENRGTVIKLGYWQPKGVIVYDRKKGFFCNEPSHSDKAKKFIDYIRREKIDVAISPEYSMPWNVLYEIIGNKELWPQKGKLWCLGLEGASYETVKDFLKEKEGEDVYLIAEDIEQLNQNEFFSCIVYLFYLEKKLICVVQFKTTAASDRWAELEAIGLTPGNTIYYFCDETHTNYLFAYICADALNQGIGVVKETVAYQKCIILHPQLNPKPLHDSFNSMRKSFLDYSKSNIRIISVNWAKETVLKRDEGEDDIVVEDSFTACYYSESTISNVEKLLVKNKKKGIDVLKDQHITIWHMPSNEHCMSFMIDGFDTRGVSNVTSSHNEPLGNTYLEYNESDWIEVQTCGVCSIDWNWLKTTFDFEKCCGNECEVNSLHKFFAILFGRKIYNDIQLENGVSSVVFDRKNVKTEKVLKLRERCGYIDEQLKEGNVPAKFSKIKNGHYRWKLGEYGNLNEDCTQEEKLLNIVYVDSSNEILIKKGIMEFQNLMGEAAKDRMLLYYFTGRGIRYYEKIYNTQINEPNFTNPIEQINEGGV